MRNNNTIYLYGVIGDYCDECDDKTVVRELNEMEGDITVRINSVGGDIFAGQTIKNALRSYNGKKTVVVEGLAASSASWIAVGAADELRMLNGSQLMIHPAMGMVFGNSEEMRHEAAILEKLTRQIADEYVRATNKTFDEVMEKINAETWFTPQEAKDFGFNVLIDDEKASYENISRVDLDRFSYKNMPKSIINAVLERPKPTIREIENSLRKSGLSQKEAKIVASRGYNGLSNQNQRDVEKENNEMLLEQAINILKNYQIF